MIELTAEQKEKVLAILKEFKPSHPWMGTNEEKQTKWNALVEKLGAAIGKEVHFKFIDEEFKRTVLESLAAGQEPPPPNPNTIYLSKFSMLTLLFSLAQLCLEATPAEAEFFSVELFQSVWPKLFGKLVAVPLKDGLHAYLKAEDAEKYRQAMEAADRQIPGPDDGGDDFGGTAPAGNA
jgi:hypothetical protein